MWAYRIGVVLALGVALAGCTGDDPDAAPPTTPPAPPSSSTTPAPAPTRGTPEPEPTSLPPGVGGALVRRTGGFIGVDEQILVLSDGRWFLRGEGKVDSGRLPDAERARVAAILADPRLAAAGTSAAINHGCADTFNYIVTVGSAVAPETGPRSS